MDALGRFLGKPQPSPAGLLDLGLPASILIHGWIKLANFIYFF